MAAQKKKDQDSYGAGSIKILEGLEAVRKRPGMYIGSTGERGLHHLVWEVVDNAVDEAMAGYATKVDVRLLEDGGVEVVDDGRGIPVGDARFRCPHRRRRHDRAARRRQVRRGRLHGLRWPARRRRLRGQCPVSRLEADIRRDGYEWFQTYDHSVPGTLKQGEASSKTGTTIRFWADPDIFETTTYDFETVARRLQEMAFLNKGLTINLTDERVTAEEVVDEVVSDTAEAPKSAEEKAAEGGGAAQGQAPHVPLPRRPGRLRQAHQPHQAADSQQRRRLLRQGRGP